MKTLVVYYSRKGSNRFLAQKIANELNCDIEEIRPRLNVFLFFLMRISLGIKALKHDVRTYDRVIMCGPIWVGQLITPHQSFIRRYRKKIKKIVFVTCCGSSYEEKDNKFGHNIVFNKLKDDLKETCSHCAAFPIPILVAEDKRKDGETIMNTRMNNDTFHGEVKEKFETFIMSLN